MGEGGRGGDHTPAEPRRGRGQVHAHRELMGEGGGRAGDQHLRTTSPGAACHRELMGRAGGRAGDHTPGTTLWSGGVMTETKVPMT